MSEGASEANSDFIYEFCSAIRSTEELMQLSDSYCSQVTPLEL